MKRRKSRIKWGNVVITVFLIIGIIVSGTLLCLTFFRGKKEVWPKKYEAKLLMVGDALIHDLVFLDARDDDGEYDFKPMLEYIKPISKKYDLAYYNQETILGGRKFAYSGYPTFNSPQEVGDAFIDAGFNLVSLANNHTMDKGEAGVLASLHYWKKQQDVVFTGQFESFEERDAVKIYEKNGIRYAFFSYTTWTNGLSTPSGKEYLNNVYSFERAKDDISKVRDSVDFVIVAMHWGIEYSFVTSSEQEQIAEELSLLGADLIIGAHPHVVQPVEYINDNKTLVIYSLGNFISSQVGIDRLTGLMMDISLIKTVNEDGSSEVRLGKPRAELIYTRYYADKEKKDYKVFPYSKLNDNILDGYLDYYDKYKKIVSSRYQELTWGLMGE